ncbi:MAG: 3-phosphoshikimate 1-carboxyvinyltransferase [Candidatus Altiarchaeales archaeon]|nr:3-phosphoshikimate 1-carboxyvinyltransferase [Candidatus Altiarchaeales archaeon]
MNITLAPSGRLSGRVKCPPSKSYTIRAVTAGLLAKGVSTIKDPLFSADTKACINVSKKFGARIEKSASSLKISGVAGKPKTPKTVLDTLNSGTTIRIMTAVSALCGNRVSLTGDESIQKRPIEPLLDSLRQLGVKASSRNGCPPVTVEGPLRGGVCSIRGDVSSQFISGLLMALPCVREDSVVNVKGELKSKPYVDLTLDILSKFGVEVENKNYSQFNIPGNQTYKSTLYTVEGDYSSAAFILAAAALTESKVTVSNLFKDSKQADKKFVSILKEMGVDIHADGDSVTVKGSGILSGIDVDLSDSPDLLPITSVVCSLAGGESKIYNVAHARLKECDRIKAMYTELRKMGASIVEKPDGLEITGRKLKGAFVNGWHDHRIVMSLAVAGLRAIGKTTITDKEFIDVTFPNFIEMMKKIGAKIN